MRFPDEEEICETGEIFQEFCKNYQLRHNLMGKRKNFSQIKKDINRQVVGDRFSIKCEGYCPGRVEFLYHQGRGSARCVEEHADDESCPYYQLSLEDWVENSDVDWPCPTFTSDKVTNQYRVLTTSLEELLLWKDSLLEAEGNPYRYKCTKQDMYGDVHFFPCMLCYSYMEIKCHLNTGYSVAKIIGNHEHATQPRRKIKKFNEHGQEEIRVDSADEFDPQEMLTVGSANAVNGYRGSNRGRPRGRPPLSGRPSQNYLVTDSSQLVDISLLPDDRRGYFVYIPGPTDQRATVMTCNMWTTTLNGMASMSNRSGSRGRGRPPGPAKRESFTEALWKPASYYKASAARSERLRKRRLNDSADENYEPIEEEYDEGNDEVYQVEYEDMLQQPEGMMNPEEALAAQQAALVESAREVEKQQQQQQTSSSKNSATPDGLSETAKSSVKVDSSKEADGYAIDGNYYQLLDIPR